MNIKRVVVISDPHCGHRVGLTPPDWDARPQNARSPGYQAWKVRRRCWRYVAELAEALQPIDLLIVNGDCIDGKGPRSGGTELLTSDRNEQVDMAAAVIDEFHAANIVMSYGTPYHVGASEDWETRVAEHKTLDVLKIGGHDWADVNGLVFDYRHFVSSSIIPHGRHTSVARERLWNALWAERDEYPKAQIFIRSHVHYHAFCGGPGWLAMTTPALMAYGSKFGVRRCSGVVDFGFVHFDIESKDEWTWVPHILRFRHSKPQAIRI